MDRTRFLVFMPLGHTIVHFPQSMQDETSLSASCSFPLWSRCRTFLMLIPENLPAGHVALQEPHDIQRLASGSRVHNCSNLLLSTVSRFMAELADNVNPKMFIPYLSLLQCGCRERQNGLRPMSRVLSWDLCRHLRRRCLSCQKK